MNQHLGNLKCVVQLEETSLSYCPPLNSFAFAFISASCLFSASNSFRAPIYQLLLSMLAGTARDDSVSAPLRDMVTARSAGNVLYFAPTQLLGQQLGVSLE